MFQRDLRSYDMIISLQNWEKTTLLAPEKLKQNLSHDFVIVIPQPNTGLWRSMKHERRGMRLPQHNNIEIQHWINYYKKTFLGKNSR